MTQVFDPFDQPPPQAPRPPRVILDRPASLQDLDLQDELLTQYVQAKQLLKDVEFADEIPLNQKAQAQNSILGILAQIIKQQETLHNVANVTRIELALVAALKECPEVKEAFLAIYTGKLEGL